MQSNGGKISNRSKLLKISPINKKKKSPCSLFLFSALRRLEERGRDGETVLVEHMKQQLEELQGEAVQLQQNELHWKEEVDRLQAR